MQTELGGLIRLFLNSRMLPRIEELSRRRADLAAQAQQSGPTHLITRFEKLDRWGAKTSPLLALHKTFASLDLGTENSLKQKSRRGRDGPKP